MWWWTPLLGALLATWPASRFTICNLQYSDSFGCSQNLRWLLIFFQEACSNVTNLRGLLKRIYAKSPSFAKYSWKFWQNWVSHLMQENVSGLANRGYAGDLLKGIFFLLGVTLLFWWSFTYRWLLFQVRLGGNSSLETRTLFLPGLHSPKPPSLLHHNYSPI